MSDRNDRYVNMKEPEAQRLAALLKARLDALGWTQTRLVEESNTSGPSVSNMVNAKVRRYWRMSTRKISQAVSWDADAIAVLAAGGPDPTVVGEPTDAAPPGIPEVIRALDDLRHLLETRLPPPPDTPPDD